MAHASLYFIIIIYMIQFMVISFVHNLHDEGI